MESDSTALVEGRRRVRAQEYLAAQTPLRTAIELDRAAREPRYLLAMCLFRSGRFDQAEVEYRALVRLDPTDAPSGYGLGVTLQRLGRVAEAESAYLDALEADPTFSRAREKVDELRRTKRERTNAAMSRRPVVEMSDSPTHLLRMTSSADWRRPLGAATVSIGTAVDNTVVIAADGISRHHSRIEFDGSRHTVRDSGSTNGTFVNGTRVSARALGPGDLIRMGRVELRYESVAPPAVAPVVPAASAVAPPAVPAKGMDAEIRDGDTGPGRLRFEGRRLLRSYLGRLIPAALFIALGMLVLADVLPLRSLGEQITRLDQVRADLERAIADGLPEVALRMYQSGVERAEFIASALSALITWCSVGLVVVGALAALSALIGTATTRYRFYDKRVDLTEGIVFRSTRKIWLYEVTDIAVEQPIPLIMGGTARIKLRIDTPEMSRITVYTAKRIHATGFGSTAEIDREAEELRGRILAQRRAIKANWL